MGIGNLGISELLIIAVIVLVFFGPSRLPEIGRSVGGALREFKKGMNEVKRELEEVERKAKGEESARERERPAGRVSPPRSIEDAPTFGTRSEADGEEQAAPAAEDARAADGATSPQDATSPQEDGGEEERA